MKSSWSDLVVFLLCCFFQSGVYLLARKHYPSSKLRCWVLTCLNSFVTPLLSFRSLFRIVNNRWEYDPVVGGSRSSRFFSAAETSCPARGGGGLFLSS